MKRVQPGGERRKAAGGEERIGLDRVDRGQQLRFVPAVVDLGRKILSVGARGGKDRRGADIDESAGREMEIPEVAERSAASFS